MVRCCKKQDFLIPSLNKETGGVWAESEGVPKRETGESRIKKLEGSSCGPSFYLGRLLPDPAQFFLGRLLAQAGPGPVGFWPIWRICPLQGFFPGPYEGFAPYASRVFQSQPVAWQRESQIKLAISRPKKNLPGPGSLK